MEDEELKCYLLAGLTESQLDRRYYTIQMDGKPFKVRVVSIGREDSGTPTKKTLLITHGYFCSGPYLMRILKDLAEKYHVVVYDNMSWGLNSRPGAESSINGGKEAAEKYTIDWMTGLIEALSDILPEKFYASGHSYGGYLTALLGSLFPERIEALFLVSPLLQSYIPETYNPYAF